MLIRSVLLIFFLLIGQANAQFGAGGSTTANNTATNTNRILCSIRAANLYLSLTTGQGSAATCDFYVLGNDLT